MPADWPTQRLRTRILVRLVLIAAALLCLSTVSSIISISSVRSSVDSSSGGRGTDREVDGGLRAARMPVRVIASGFEEPAGLAFHPAGFLLLSDHAAGVLYRLIPGV